jgi:hypothetical protein
MLRVAALLSVAIAMQGVAIAEDDKQDSKQDTVQVHGKSLQLSCAEWKRNQDGSWTSTGPLLVCVDEFWSEDVLRFLFGIRHDS